MEFLPLRTTVRRVMTLVALMVALVPTQFARAQAPAIVPVTGVLTDSDGTPVDGSHRLTLTLYDDATAGTALYTDDYTSIELNAGHFVVYLGGQGGTPLDLALFRDNALWLEAVIDGTEIITPRVRLGAVPYAGFAQYCGDTATLEGMGASAFAQATHTHDWSDIASGVPAEVANLANGDPVTLPAGPATVQMSKLYMGRNDANVISYTALDGTTYMLDIVDPTMAYSNTHIAYAPGSPPYLLFNIEGTSGSCTLLHYEDDLPRAYEFATDGGNSGIVSTAWGNSETFTFMLTRAGLSNTIPIEVNRGFHIMCF